MIRESGMREIKRIGALALALVLGLTLVLAVPFGVGTSVYAEEAESISFTDVESTHWASANIAFAVEKGIVKGYFDQYSNTYTFRPDNSVTYEEATAMLWRALVAAEVVTDDEAGAAAAAEKFEAAMAGAGIASWAKEYVARFMEMDIIKEADLSAFVGEGGLGNPAPREVVAVWTAKALGRDLAGVDYLPYTDMAEIPYADRGYIDMLYRQGIMKGSLQGDGLLYFLPNAGVRRSEFAAIANRVYENKSGEYDYSKDFYMYSKAEQAPYLTLAPNFVMVSNGSSAQLMRSGDLFLSTYINSGKAFVLSGMAMPEGEVPQVHLDNEPATGQGKVMSVDSVYIGKDNDVEKVGIEINDLTVYFLKTDDTKSSTRIRAGLNVTFIADGVNLVEIKETQKSTK